MARSHFLWLPALAACALFGACGGVSETGFFGPVLGTGGSGGSNQAGAPPNTGASPSASSGSPGNAGGASNAGGVSIAGQGTSIGGGPPGSGSAGGGAGSNSSGPAGAAGSASGSGGSSGTPSSIGGFTSAGAAGTAQDLSCSELITQGTRQLAAARVCNLTVDALQCTGKVTNRCNCQIPVQRLDSAETKAYQETLKQLDAKNCMPTCTAVCTPLSSAACSPSSSSTGTGPTGTCVASYNGSVP